MLKVRFETITLRVPVIDNSGEHDAKISQEEFDGIFETIQRLEELTGERRRWPGGDPAFAQGGISRVFVGTARPPPPGVSFAVTALTSPDARVTLASPPVSQVDPPINTAVSDREMRSSEPDISLEEFRERPEKTRAPPRPRANSWRHER